MSGNPVMAFTCYSMSELFFRDVMVLFFLNLSGDKDNSIHYYIARVYY